MTRNIPNVQHESRIIMNMKGGSELCFNGECHDLTRSDRDRMWIVQYSGKPAAFFPYDYASPAAFDYDYISKGRSV